MNPKRIEWDFRHHVPDEKKAKDHAEVRADCLFLARRFNEILPDSREKSLAITKVEEAMYWANAALARNPRPENAK